MQTPYQDYYKKEGNSFRIVMDEKEYNEIIKRVEELKGKYQLEKGILYKLKDGKRLKVVRKYEFEGIMYLMHDHELSAHFEKKNNLQKSKGKILVERNDKRYRGIR